MDSCVSPPDEIRIVEIVVLPERPSRPRRKFRGMRLAGLLFVALSIIAVAVPLIAAGFQAVRCEQCNTHLKRLGLAFMEYSAAKDRFPAPAITRSDGTPLLSWRVEILPYLGYQSLYDRFHLDEPWDSPHNAALISEMPAEFVCPTLTKRQSGRTGYLVVVGPKSDMGTVNTAFEPGRGVDIREFTDGTSSSALVVETDTLVPWTKPEDLTWAPGEAPPPMRIFHTTGLHVLFADGSVRLIKPVLLFDRRLAIFTINGGEVLSSS